MIETPLFTLDQLPPVPDLKIPAPGMDRAISAAIEAVNAATEKVSASLRTAEALISQFEGLGDNLAKSATRLCETVETLAVDPADSAKVIEDLAKVSADLLSKERATAKLYLPFLEDMRRSRVQVATLGQGKALAADVLAAIETTVERGEDAVARPLEQLRDARLRIDRRRADLINQLTPDGSVFDDGEKAAAYIRSLRR